MVCDRVASHQAWHDAPRRDSWHKVPCYTTRSESNGAPSTIGLLVLASVLVGSPLLAADPQIGRIAPCGGQRGTEVEVFIDGPRLADAQELLLYYPGIRVAHFEVVEGKRIKARLAIAPYCRLGLHAFRVRAASGISNLLQFSVGPLPQIDEAEPNNEFHEPQKIGMNVTVGGVVENEDVDYFQVEAKKGQRISVEVEGIRLGETFFDPYVAILNKDRFVLAGSDDNPLVYQDAACSVQAPEDGAYVVQVRESSFGGNGSCRYRLHVGDFPRPMAVYPAGGRFGQALEVEWLGDAAGPWKTSVTLPGGPQPMFGLVAQDPLGSAPSLNEFRLGELNNVMEAEPNNGAGEATAGEAPAAFNGVIGQDGDVDCFKFAAKKGQVLDVRVYARAIRSPLDSVLTVLRASNGAGVGGNDDSGAPDSYLRMTAPEDDQYVVIVQDQLLKGGPTYVYRVEVTEVKPRLTLGLPERQQFVDITAPVPQGNRLALLVSAQREDFGGDLALEIKDLPAGISMETVPITADQTTVPVLLAAAADAPLAGSLADVIGRTTADPKVEGRLRQRASMVRGQNNREIWNHYTERIAAAVAQKVPYQVEIVQPKVPLVQSGEMALKIVAKRDEGFKAPITLSMLYNPPGVSTPTSVAIPEGQNEVIMPVTANGGATVRKWKIAVLGQATVGDGTVIVSSQLADLDVSEPFFRFNYTPAAVEQGQSGQVAIEVAQNKPFDGPAKIELLGLPNEVTSEPKEITKETKQLTFPVKTTANSPPGQHKSLLCRAIVTAEGEPITHMIGGGELRIQKPLPQKPAEQPKPQPKPEETKPAEKPLSRLEQLRLQKS
ncbi:MAG: PPC domain-containing protein [Pirellulales bacterium]|nr:PPC domain-containing protein [Pirellulales bacterium]